MEFALRGTFFFCFYNCLKKSIDTLLNEMQRLACERGRFVFQEKSGDFHILALSVHEVCDATMFSSNIIVGGCSLDRKLLIETMMEEIEEVV